MLSNSGNKSYREIMKMRKINNEEFISRIPKSTAIISIIAVAIIIFTPACKNKKDVVLPYKRIFVKPGIEVFLENHLDLVKEVQKVR